MEAVRTCIVGAGASGLSLALMLDDAVVWEASPRPGGHASSTIRDGWTFDRGPHILFSRNDDVLEFLVRILDGNVHRSRRNSKVCIDGHFSKYPIENDLGALPAELRERCILDFLFNDERKDDSGPADLDEWFTWNFGRALTDLYFRPYNEKVWKCPTSELSMTWADRIPLPPPKDVVRGALGISTEGYQHQLYFHYPRLGGYQALTDAMATRVGRRLWLNSPVTAIRRERGRTVVEGPAGAASFDTVVSTMPLHRLVEIVDMPVPPEVAEAVNALQVNPMVVVTLGFEGTDEHQFSSVYFPDPEFLVNRTSSPCTFSPENGPPGAFSIQAEITCAPGDPVFRRADPFFVDHVLQGLRRHRVVEPQHHLIFSAVERFDFAYVVYRRGYERHLELAKEWFESQGILPHGRFGAFEYLNVDGCVLRSLELAERLSGRKPQLSEIT